MAPIWTVASVRKTSRTTSSKACYAQAFTATEPVALLIDEIDKAER
jgi:hypothetical protein